MSESKNGKPKLGEASPNLGMVPLFPDKREIASAERAHARALHVLESERIETTETDWLQSELVSVAQRYWAEYERDSKVTFSNMKKGRAPSARLCQAHRATQRASIGDQGSAEC